jgi:hypothetical protein
MARRVGGVCAAKAAADDDVRPHLGRYIVYLYRWYLNRLITSHTDIEEDGSLFWFHMHTIPAQRDRIVIAAGECLPDA